MAFASEGPAEGPTANTFRFKPPVTDANFDWIRTVNDSPARKARMGFAKTTEDAIAKASYTYRSLEVPLLSVEGAEFGTQVVSPGAGVWPQLPETPPHSATECRRIDCPTATVLDVALQLTQRGHRVAAISAASAYHCGGGFKTGGRHALEEAMCVQSTLFRCLDYAKTQAGVEPGCAYFPPDAAILSPQVEVFRGGTGQGYPFLPSPVQLAGVVSVAMPNFNPRVRDAPPDSFKDEHEYMESLRSRWRAALRAACALGATDIVCPDAGCGVYKNDAAAVGATLREVIHTEYWGQVKDIWLVGASEFCDAVGIIAGPEATDSNALTKRGNMPWKKRFVRKLSRASSDGGASTCTTGDLKPADADTGAATPREKREAGQRDDNPGDGRTLKLSAANLKRLYTKYTGGSGQSPKSNKKPLGHRRSASQCTDTTQGAESSYAGSVVSESEFEVELRMPPGRAGAADSGSVKAKEASKLQASASAGSCSDHEGTCAASTAAPARGTAQGSAGSLASEEAMKKEETIDASVVQDREFTEEIIDKDMFRSEAASEEKFSFLPPSSFNDQPGADFARAGSHDTECVAQPCASPKPRPGFFFPEKEDIDVPDSCADAEPHGINAVKEEGGPNDDDANSESGVAEPPPPCRRTRPGLALLVGRERSCHTARGEEAPRSCFGCGTLGAWSGCGCSESTKRIDRGVKARGADAGPRAGEVRL